MALWKYNADVIRTVAGCSLLLVAACVRTGTVGFLQAESETGAGVDGDDGSGREVGDGMLLDLPDDGVDVCSAREDGMLGVGKCTQAAPPGSLEPVIQWEWTGPDGDTDTRVIQLVVNLTDDNDDGTVDLCDTPDIIVTAGPPPEGNLMTTDPPHAHLYALDGASGSTHWRSDELVRAAITPALADIDGDRDVEIVTLQSVGDPVGLRYPSRLVAFDHNGALAWASSVEFLAPASGAVALADLDQDGDAEIMIGNQVFDHLGERMFVATDVGEDSGLALMPVAVDLDDDDDLEVVWARAAYHDDGSELWRQSSQRHGFVQIANFDEVPGPEIIVTTSAGIFMLAADGTPLTGRFKPRLEDGMRPPDSDASFRRPAAIHDVNRDRQPEILLSAAGLFAAVTVARAGGEFGLAFSFTVDDTNGSSAGTAFDLLGDSTAEALYADRTELYAYNPDADEFAFTASRTSVTVEDYPVVADVDNDGSAEIVVGSSATVFGADPTVRVFGDPSNRWVQARRIWNEHTYHVTNVAENGVLPNPEAHHWERTNTFRTNAQIEAGAVCQPEP